MLVNFIELHKTIFVDITNLVDVIDFLRNQQFLATQWEDLGLYLGISYNTLVVIENENKEKCDPCLKKCLAAWLLRKYDVMNRGGPSWKSLNNALEKIQKRNIAQ